MKNVRNVATGTLPALRKLWIGSAITRIGAIRAFESNSSYAMVPHVLLGKEILGILILAPFLLFRHVTFYVGVVFAIVISILIFFILKMKLLIG